jgi:hypothetical protein
MDQALAAKVRAMAENCQVADAVIIRWAIDALLKHVEANDGKLPLPIVFGESKANGQLIQELLDELRNRTGVALLPADQRPRGKNEPVWDDQNPRDQASLSAASPIQAPEKGGPRNEHPPPPLPPPVCARHPGW